METTEAEDNPAFVFPCHPDRGREEEENDEDDGGNGDECGGHLTPFGGSA
jgi:hypothetical protein